MNTSFTKFKCGVPFFLICKVLERILELVTEQSDIFIDLV